MNMALLTELSCTGARASRPKRPGKSAVKGSVQKQHPGLWRNSIDIAPQPKDRTGRWQFGVAFCLSIRLAPMFFIHGDF